MAKIHHKNLVSLIGYCKDKEYMALVYEYMSEGTLREHLSGMQITEIINCKLPEYLFYIRRSGNQLTKERDHAIHMWNLFFEEYNLLTFCRERKQYEMFNLDTTTPYIVGICARLAFE